MHIFSCKLLQHKSIVFHTKLPKLMDFEGYNNSSPSSSPPKKQRSGQTLHPRYRSVRRRSNGKWVCEVRDPHTRSRIWLGTFLTPAMAAVAHDVALLSLHGDDAAPLNYPDSAHLFPRAASCSHQDIQRAAQQAAREFNPPSPSDVRDRENSPAPSSSSSRIDEELRFVDEEAVFNMPALIDGMAEGMLLTPPALKKGFNWSQLDEEDGDTDVTLWKF